MRAVIQRVSKASVLVDGSAVGRIDGGIMALVGFSPEDDDKTFEYMLAKMMDLRIFQDSQGKMNLSVKDTGGGILIVPNFTLYGDCRKGRRPGYSTGAPSAVAEGYFSRFVGMAKNAYDKVESGIFQAEMAVQLVNDGPVTLLLDSEKVF